MSNPPGSEQRIVHFQGRVQGVGFRYTARQIAADHQVAGYVKNLPDGRVELVCEGAAGELDRFLAAVRFQMDRYITAVQENVVAATGEFKRFEIVDG